jgi:hypothetical protein
VKTTPRKSQAIPFPPVPATFIPVEARISAKHLKTATEFCNHYDLPIDRFLSEQVYGQAETINDGSLFTLERIHEEAGIMSPKDVTLYFCEDVHALLSRIAQIIRIPLPRFANHMIAASIDTLDDYMDECRRKPEDLDSRDMADWADRAIKFHRLQKQNQTRGWKSEADGWAAFGLTRPSKKGGKQ